MAAVTLAANLATSHHDSTHQSRQPPSTPPHLFVHAVVTPPSSIFSTILLENSSAVTPLSLHQRASTPRLQPPSRVIFSPQGNHGSSGDVRAPVRAAPSQRSILHSHNFHLLRSASSTQADPPRRKQHSRTCTRSKKTNRSREPEQHHVHSCTSHHQFAPPLQRAPSLEPANPSLERESALCKP